MKVPSPYCIKQGSTPANVHEDLSDALKVELIKSDGREVVRIGDVTAEVEQPEVRGPCCLVLLLPGQLTRRWRSSNLLWCRTYYSMTFPNIVRSILRARMTAHRLSYADLLWRYT